VSYSARISITADCNNIRCSFLVAPLLVDYIRRTYSSRCFDVHISRLDVSLGRVLSTSQSIFLLRAISSSGSSMSSSSADLTLTCSEAGSVLGAFTSSALSGSFLTSERGSSASQLFGTLPKNGLPCQYGLSWSWLICFVIAVQWRRCVDNKEEPSILPLPFVLASDKFTRIEIVYSLAFLVLFDSYSYVIIPLVALGGSPQSGSRLFISGCHSLPHALYVVIVSLA